MKPEQAFSIGRQLVEEYPYEPIGPETQKLSYLERFKKLGEELHRYSTDTVIHNLAHGLVVREFRSNHSDPTDKSALFGTLIIKAKYRCLPSTITRKLGDPSQLEEISAQWAIEGRVLPEERITKDLITESTEPQGLDPLFQLIEDSIETSFPGFRERHEQFYGESAIK